LERHDWLRMRAAHARAGRQHAETMQDDGEQQAIRETPSVDVRQCGRAQLAHVRG
jgi:hypothetical protein